ncbi:TIGR02678 family protein [Brevibacillus brevis]|uniref:TIGR02678 family protein n=1 Tax=Brevibacillus brevis TaxID=1393 RepID=UPI000D0FE92A|nr:TIGR02678 family protein [Brevibacillus brevis]PSJ68697.1 TIGR02678 family protein [Brevibacillus brevis]RED33133.1 uncharacterized protein (TIGR02678 family) [Brevibacillus brevis]GEC93304.1 hypothetical protein BBR01nite_56350 [Brevibacillus brevis]VEF90803.1 Protein of uncharacterised function (DUF2398) [Brevibacillus brevis]
MKNEEWKKAVNLLLEQYWIVREEKMTEFDLIKKFETPLKIWFREKMGYELVVYRKIFARLEKIPAHPTPNLVLNPESFRNPMDYTVFFALLAFFENRYDETFLISEFCEELRSFLGEKDNRFLETHRNRLSLIRVFKYAVKTGILVQRDGDIDAFEEEVLFKIPPIAQFFIRQFPCTVGEGMLDPEQFIGLHAYDRRQLIYRTLLLEPSLLYERLSLDDVKYVKQQYEAIEVDIGRHTPFHLERFIEGILAVRDIPEGSVYQDYPSDTSISDISLQIADRLKEELKKGSLRPYNGWIDMNRNQWEQILHDLKDTYGEYWKKEYDDMKLGKWVEEITRYLFRWGMAELPDSYTVRISPHILRASGRINISKGVEKHELETESGIFD